ncbi:hypothetical protein ACHQM5_025621 [Ranunculus cassubicifolius]
MDHDSQQWMCEARVELTTGAETVWASLSDFFSIGKWLPPLGECIPLEGNSGEPGCVRCCRTPTGVLDSCGIEIVKLATERLVFLDNTERCFSYEMMDNNLGYKSYKATMKVIPDGEKDVGCRIEWSFTVEPVQGWTHEGMISHQEYVLGIIAKTIDEAYAPR